MSQRHSSRLLIPAGPAKSSLFQPLEARNTLPPVSALFIDWVLLIGCRSCAEHVFQAALLSRNCEFQGAVDPRV